MDETETGDIDAEFDVSWWVSDPDGDLSLVEFTLIDTRDDTTGDTASSSVSGDTAISGVPGTRLVASDDGRSGHTYTVQLAVADEAGTTTTQTESLTEKEADTEPEPGGAVSIGTSGNARAAASTVH